MISAKKIPCFMLLAVLGGCGGGDGGSTTGEPVLASATTMVDGTAVGTPNPTWPITSPPAMLRLPQVCPAGRQVRVQLTPIHI